MISSRLSPILPLGITANDVYPGALMVGTEVDLLTFYSRMIQFSQHPRVVAEYNTPIEATTNEELGVAYMTVAPPGTTPGGWKLQGRMTARISSGVAGGYVRLDTAPNWSIIFGAGPSFVTGAWVDITTSTLPSSVPLIFKRGTGWSSVLQMVTIETRLVLV